MARKTSDIGLLLAGRGNKSRSRVSFTRKLNKFLDGVLGRSSNALSGRSSRRRGDGLPQVSMWVLGLAVAAAFGAGFLLGGTGKDAFAGDSGKGSLRATPTALTPGFVGEVDTQRLADRAFVVSAYPEAEPGTARQQATALSLWLQAQGVQRARPYHWRGSLWVVAVYFRNEAEQQATREQLLALPADVPDAEFLRSRTSTSGWPKDWAIQ